MAEDCGDDHSMHSLTTELGGHRMAHVVQTGRGMQASQASKTLEGVREGVGVQEGSVPALAHERNRSALVIDWITPPCSQDRAPFELFSPMTADAQLRKEATVWFGALAWSSAA